MLPRYVHDCDSCRYLGTDKEGQDWYVCGLEESRSIIRRYGDEGCEYAANAIAICVTMTPLERLAARMGFEFNDYEKLRFAKQYIARDIEYKFTDKSAIRSSASLSSSNNAEEGPAAEDEELLCSKEVNADVHRGGIYDEVVGDKRSFVYFF